MPALIACPDPARLSQLVDGTASADEIESFAQHLETCATCVQRLEQTTVSSFIADAVRQSAKPVPLIVDERVQALMNRLDKMVSSQTDPYQTVATPSPDSQAVQTSAEGTAKAGDDTEADYLAWLEPAQDASELGRLGPYRILKVLGVGGMGVVYHAEDTTLKRSVALKAMKPGLSSNRAARQRFLREAQTAAAVRHDNIVIIYQAGEHNQTAFLAMECLQGETLEDLLERDGRLPLAETLRIGREIADGLAAAHAHDLIHRDIKPSNLWLEASPGRMSGKSRVKILDFGLARAAAGDVKLTQSGTILGTPAYMAPEQADGQPVDARADLFSLGCVLYRMATGEMPFKGEGVMQILRAIALTEPTPPCQVNPEIPIELSELIMKLLEKRPGNRLASADEVSRRLRMLENVTKAAVAFTLAPKSVEPVPTAKRKRPRWPLLIAAAVAVIVGIVLIPQIVTIRFTDKDGKKQEIALPDGAKDVKVIQPPLPAIPTGEPMGITSLVTRPAKLDGAASWTLETKGHRGAVRSVAYSPDGKWLASAGDDGCIRLWEPDGSKLARVIVVEGAIFLSDLVWSPDGKCLASAFWNQEYKVGIWDVHAARKLRTFKTAGGPISWSDGNKLLIGAKLYDPIEGALIDDVGVPTSVLSPDGTKLASLEKSGSELKLRDAKSMELIGTASMADGGYHGRSYMWSPDSKYVAIGNAHGSDEPVLRVVDSSTGKVLYEAGPRAGGTQTCLLAGSSDGKQLALGIPKGHCTQIFIINSADGKKLREFEQLTPAEDAARSIAWSKDGKFIAAGTDQGSIVIYDVSTGQHRRVVPGHHNVSVINLTWLADGKTLISDFSGGSGPVINWEIGSGKMRHIDGPVARARSADGRLALQREGALLDVATGKPMHSRIIITQNDGAAFSPDGQNVITAITGTPVSLWEARTSTQLKSFPIKSLVHSTVALSADGKQFAYRSGIFDAESGKLIRALDAEGRCAFSPDGNRLAVLGITQLYVFIANGAKLERTIPATMNTTTPPAWSSDSKLVAAGNSDIRVWDAATGKPVAVLVRLANDQGLAISAEGHFCGSPSAPVQREIVYVVQTAQGQETLTPAEMEKKYGWKNDPDRVRLAP